MNEAHVSALDGDVDDEWTVALVKDTAEEPANGSANAGHLETEELSLGQQLLQGKWSNRFEDVENSPEDWLVAGLVLKGHMTMLSADPKCGKSTLLNQMYKPLTDVDGGEFLGINVIGNKKIMVISEDNKRIAKRAYFWEVEKRMLRRFGIRFKKNFYFFCGHSFARIFADEHHTNA